MSTFPSAYRASIPIVIEIDLYLTDMGQKYIGSFLRHGVEVPDLYL